MARDPKSDDFGFIPNDDFGFVPTEEAPEPTSPVVKKTGLKEFLFGGKNVQPSGTFVPEKGEDLARKPGTVPGTYYQPGGKQVVIEPMDIKPEPRSVLGEINPFDPETDPKKWAAASTAEDFLRVAGSLNASNLMFGMGELSEKTRDPDGYLSPQERWGVTDQAKEGIPGITEMLLRAPADVANIAMVSSVLGAMGITAPVAAGAGGVAGQSLAQKGVGALASKFPAATKLVQSGLGKISSYGSAPAAFAKGFAEKGTNMAVDFGVWGALDKGGAEAQRGDTSAPKIILEGTKGFVETAPLGFLFAGAGPALMEAGKYPVKEVGKAFTKVKPEPVANFGDFVKARGGIDKADLQAVAKDAIKEGFPLEEATPNAVKKLYRKDAAQRKAGNKGVEPIQMQTVQEPLPSVAPAAQGPKLPQGPSLVETAPIEFGKPIKSKVDKAGAPGRSTTIQANVVKRGGRETYEISASSSPERLSKGQYPLAGDKVWSITKTGEDGFQQVVGEGMTQQSAKKLVSELAAESRAKAAALEPALTPSSIVQKQLEPQAQASGRGTKSGDPVVPATEPSPLVPPPIGNPPSKELTATLPGKLKRKWDDFLQVWQDDTRVVHRIMTVAGNEPRDVLQNPREYIKLMRGVDSKVKYDIDAVIESLLPIKNNYAAFEKYALYKRAYEKQIQADMKGGPGWTGKDIVGKTADELRIEAERLSKQYPEFEKIRQDLVRFNHASLKQLADSGVISREAYKKMKLANLDYMAFHRTPNPKAMARQRRLKGTGQMDDLEDVVVASLKNHVAVSRLAYANNMAVKMVEFVEKNNAKLNPYIKQVEGKSRKIKFESKEIMDQLENLGVDVSGLDPKSSLEIWRSLAQAPPGAFTVWRNGKPEYWKPTDFAEPLFGLMQDPYSAVRTAEGKINFIDKFLRKSARGLRMTATELNPAFFMYRNPVRDMQSRWIQTSVGMDGPKAKRLRELVTGPFKDAVDVPRAMADIMGKSDLYKEWLKNGGAFQSLASLDQKVFQSEFHRLAGMRKGALGIPVPYSARHPIEAVRRVAAAFENMNRIIEYKNVLRAEMAAGTPVKEAVARAIRASHEVSINFRTAGHRPGRAFFSGRAANRYIPFFNASIQGTARMMKLYRKNPATMFARHTAYVGIPGITMWYMIQKDPELKAAWEKMPEYRKRVFYHIPKKWLGGAYDTVRSGLEKIADAAGIEMVDKAFESPFIEIGRPFEYGMWGRATENFLEYTLNEDPTAVEDLLVGTIWNGMFPNVSAPVMDLLFALTGERGYSFFKGRDVLSDRDRRVWPEMQYSATTPLTLIETADQVRKVADKIYESDLGRKFPDLPSDLQEKLGSPKRLQEYLGIQFGGLGKLLVEVTDIVGKKAGLFKERGKLRGQKAITGLNTESLQKFYQFAEMGSKTTASFNRAIKEQDPERAKTYFERPRMKAGQLTSSIFNQKRINMVGDMLDLHTMQVSLGDPDAVKTAEIINKMVEYMNQMGEFARNYALEESKKQ